MKLASIPPHLPFLDTLAARWLQQATDPSRGLILLPTRRAARALAEAFLRAGNGRPMLLPRIAALGALDEAPLALAGALDLPPAVDAMERLAALSRMVLALPPERGGARGADGAWLLAQALAELMDEAEWAEIDLPTALAGAADQAHAEHWQVTLDFLGIVTRSWPDWLADQALMNPAARQAALLHAQAQAWRDTPPAEPVWIAGTTAALPPVAALLRVVAALPRGLVVLPGLDTEMDGDSWQVLDEPHPQSALRHLLASLDATRDDVATWTGTGTVPPGRVATLGAALLPAPSLGAWRQALAPDITGLSRLTPADQQEEAAAIALLLREAIETPNQRAALVTPDRGLAVRVSAELLRWGVVADDSAGEPLDHTPPSVFLRLLAGAVAEGLAPVALLALLKHPLAAAGLPAARCRDAARTLEVAVLRGPRPQAGMAALRRHLDALDRPPEAARDLLARLQDCLAPLLRVCAAAVAAPANLLAALIAAAEALATTDTEAGPARLWAHEEGEALATVLAAAQSALALLPDQAPAVLPGLLDALVAGEVVRSRRALRGRGAGMGEHPRVFIWGLLEARLQAADVVVLGGLAEGVWPPATDPGPWLSRPMRRSAGLRSPEEAVGQAAHDFVMASCCAPVVVLSCPERRDRAPAVPSRWLARLTAFLDGQGVRLAAHPAVEWAQRLDQPLNGPRPARPPLPRPAVALRPRALSITEIETWLADPYAIYARHVLKLRALAPLDQAIEAIDYGTLVHAGLERFLNEVGAAWPADAHVRLRDAMDRALAEQEVRPALFAWWAPRLHRIAAWVAEQEIARRSVAPPLRLAVECKGDWALDVPKGFRLRGRADRIERRADGLLAILDYKTGTPPAASQVEQGHAPQLLLEAAMVTHGAFGTDVQGRVGELAYWHLTGGHVAGRALPMLGGDADAIAATADEAHARLRALIADFDRLERGYPCAPHPGRAARGDDYAQLARKAEWDQSADGE